MEFSDCLIVQTTVFLGSISTIGNFWTDQGNNYFSVTLGTGTVGHWFSRIYATMLFRQAGILSMKDLNQPSLLLSFFFLLSSLLSLSSFLFVFLSLGLPFFFAPFFSLSFTFFCLHPCLFVSKLNYFYFFQLKLKLLYFCNITWRDCCHPHSRSWETQY